VEVTTSGAGCIAYAAKKASRTGTITFDIAEKHIVQKHVRIDNDADRHCLAVPARTARALFRPLRPFDVWMARRRRDEGKWAKPAEAHVW